MLMRYIQPPQVLFLCYFFLLFAGHFYHIFLQKRPKWCPKFLFMHAWSYLSLLYIRFIELYILRAIIYV